MTIKAVALGLGLVLAMGAAAQAEDLTGDSTSEILDIAKSYGTARLETRDDNSPQIVGRVADVRYQLLFRNCDDNGSGCEDVQFYAGLIADDKPTLEAINEYNKTSRFGRAYLDDDQDPVIEWDIDLSHGTTTEEMESAFDLWSQLVERFKSKFGS